MGKTDSGKAREGITGLRVSALVDAIEKKDRIPKIAKPSARRGQ